GCTENDASNESIFGVTREPTLDGESGPESPANAGHCGIRNARLEYYRSLGKKPQRKYTDMMRVKLIKLAQDVLTYEKVFEQAA
ncbi:hypothetical protein, partial [Salipiger marinus]